MRMWNVPTNFLCRNHLLGEHLEMHMFATCIKEEKTITGYIEKGEVEPSKVKSRHDELAREMIVRGYNHKSPLESFKVNGLEKGCVDIPANIRELARRCPKCKDRILSGKICC